MSVPALLNAVAANFRKLKLAGIDLNCNVYRYESVFTYREKQTQAEVSHVAQQRGTYNVAEIHVYETEVGNFIIGEASHTPSVLRTISVATHEFLHLALNHAKRSQTIVELHPELNSERLMLLLTTLEHIELTNIQKVCDPQITDYFSNPPVEYFTARQCRTLTYSTSIEKGFEDFLYYHPNWFGESVSNKPSGYAAEPRQLVESSTEKDGDTSIPAGTDIENITELLRTAKHVGTQIVTDRVDEITNVLKGYNAKAMRWEIYPSRKYRDTGYLRKTSKIWFGDIALDISGSMSGTVTFRGKTMTLLELALGLVGILENVANYHLFNTNIKTFSELPEKILAGGGTDFELLDALSDDTIVITDAEGDLTHLERFRLVIVINNPTAHANNFYHI